MELNREQLVHGVFTSALFGIGALVGNALIGATLTGISVNLASTLVQSTWSQFCREHLLEPNHDLQKIWARAVRRALSQLEELWWKTLRGSQIEREDAEQKTAIKQLFRQLQTDSGQFFGSAAQAAQTADAYFNIVLPAGAEPSSTSQMFAERLQRYLEGHEKQLLAFFDQNFLEIFGFCFVEELKSDDPDSSRAWRALQLFLLRDLSSQLDQLRLEQQKASQLLDEINARSKRIEVGQNNEQEKIGQDVLPPERPGVREGVAFFVGRELELTYYAGQLNSSRIAVLTGIAGLGKTELALRLARKLTDEDKIFWHTFHEDEDLISLLWKVAAFLYWQDQQELWHRLCTVGLEGAKAPPEILLDFLTPMLRKKEYVFCLDGFQFVDRDPQMLEFMGKLVSAAQTGQLSLIITSRYTNALLAEFVADPLSGFTAADALRLLVNQGISLPTEQFQTLHECTDGNPQLLILAADLLRQSPDSKSIIDSLFRSDDIEGYLVDEIDKSLKSEEKDTLCVMSALLGYPASRDAVETLLANTSVREVLRTLSQRYLVTVHGVNHAKRYTVHPALQGYYYASLNPARRRQLHQRAGEYYETEEVSGLEAALHYQRAGLTDKAIGLTTSNLSNIIQQGQVRRLQQLLERLLAESSDSRQKIKVELALGEIFGRQGELSKALEWMQAARDHSASSAGDETTEALAMVEIRSASLYYQMGESEEGEIHAQRGLDLLGETGSISARAEGYLLLGSTQDAQSKSSDALAAYQTSLEMWSSLNNTFEMARVRNNIGTIYFSRGEWSRAKDTYESVYRFFSEQVEDEYRLAVTATNLGLLAYNRGNYDSAQKYHTQAIEIAQRLGILWLAAVARVNMAWVHVAWDELDKAEELANENVRLESVSDIAESLPESYRVLAQVAAGRGILDQASVYAQQALDLAHSQSNRLEEANARRVLGKILRLQNQPESAQQHLLASLEQLDALPNRFEAARTKRQLVWLYKDSKDDSTALVYAIDALTTFAAMDARGELSSMQANNRLTFWIQRSLSAAIEQTSARMTDAGWIRQKSDSPAAITGEGEVLYFLIDPHTAQLTFVAHGSEVVLTIQVMEVTPTR